MNGKLTIGQYYPGNSIIHNLDARVKLIGSFVLIILIFFASNLAGYALSAAFAASCVLVARIPPRMLIRGLRSIAALIVFAAILNLFFAPGERVLLEFAFLRLTAEGLLVAAKMIARFILLIVISSLLTLTTSPLQLTDAIEYLLKPFKMIGVPAHELAMMMTIALRYIPLLIEEMDKIKKAQMARGADFESGGLFKRAKSLIPLLVPLFVSAFRRADDLAVAMEARCYRGDEGRTKMKVMRMTAIDGWAVLAMLLFSVGLAATRFLT